MRTPLYVASIAVCIAAPQARTPARPSAPRAGTYIIRRCRSTCAPGDTVAGERFVLLVLNPSAIDLRGTGDSARWYLSQSYMFAHADGPPNACNVAIAPRHDPDAGLSHWSPRDTAGVHVDLERSPDSGWTLDLEIHGDAVSGTAHVWGASDPHPVNEQFPVTGRRIGGPDLRPCVDSALAADRVLHRTLVHALQRGRSTRGP